MNFAQWIMLVGGLLPYFIVASAKATKQYDNWKPREPGNYEGWRARAYSAHSNAQEAFPFFAAAVLLATLRNADTRVVTIAAGVWLVARLLHWFTYVTNRATARSLVWFVATFATLTIFIAALIA